MLIHNVYFRLKDPSEAAIAKLIAACREHLTGHPGTRFFACGPREKGLERPVNVTDFHVGLHIIFETRADHDAYQVSERHKRFVRENEASWDNARVFDTTSDAD